MSLDIIISGLILILAFYILFLVGKVIHDLLHREFKLNHELFERDNPAMALAIVGYYGGLVLAIGGVLVGPSQSLFDDLIDIGIYGLLGIILLNLSWYICDTLILYRFKMADELIRDRNQGTGAVSAGISIASGFLIFGSVQGEGGSIWSVVALWALGQAFLIIAGWVYNRITPYDIHHEIEQDNIAAGISFGGALVAIGAVLGLAAEGNFSSWSEDLPDYLGYALIGLILLPVVRVITDKVLIPSVKLSKEIAGQEKANVGAAYIEAFSYIAAAFIIYWCV